MNRPLLAFTLAFLGLTTLLPAQRRTLQVATKTAVPFAFERDGRWSGLSIELWENLAKNLDYDVKPEYLDAVSVDGLLAAVRPEGGADVAVAALTVTAERGKTVGFTHPIISSGLGIATRTSEEGGVFAVLSRLASMEFLGLVLALLLLLAIVGAALWAFERRRNAQQFGGTAAQGLGAGLWWSAVTMTTVGYGDKSPTTLGGRAIALAWMFASILIISTFTAAIASSLTVSQLEGVIQGPEDLPRARIGSVSGTTSGQWLDDQGLRFRSFASVNDAMAELAGGKLDAVVYDAPILEWLASREFDGLKVLPQTLMRQDYAFALRKNDNELREAINEQLLTFLHSEGWERLKAKYFGAH
ncbi:MAG: transporter substrate-binding domain-containing protein [Planctomycetes bacterium]|nr:transporter substrate-binding domain-containing protein [Planctomycetota bacterium]